METDAPIAAVERAIAQQDPDLARRALCKFLFDEPPRDPPNDAITDAISALANDGALHTDKAIYLLRCLTVSNLLPPPNSANLLHANLVTICERSLPQVCRFLHLQTKRQTHEKLFLLQTVHERVISLLEPLSSMPTTLSSFVAKRQDVLHALNHDLVDTYCRPFLGRRLRTGVEITFSSLSQLLHAEIDISLLLGECDRQINSLRVFCDNNFNFLTLNFFRPFLETAALVIDSHVKQARRRFVTSISCRLGPANFLQKNYPLHEEGRDVFVSIPLHNFGPGTALSASCKVETDSDDVLFVEDSLFLGNITAGDFSTNCHVFIVNTCVKFSFMFTISWLEVGDAERKEAVFVINVASQRPDINWTSLAYQRPYSTEVAKGSAFVGRSEKVLELAHYLLRTPMDSFYVTGQKRVGKTSLALAALDFAQSHEKGDRLQGLYLLWGAIAHEDPRASLKQLGERIARFIEDTFPSEQQRVTHEFEGSLATLIPLAELAHRLDPQRRYVVVIDEFDEIHPELYMQDNLAETFFANIRAINTCANVCIVLVGGENMPFIMERQGQKLNKFVRVTLDYFSRDEEWEDFKLLLRRPTEGSVQWHDDAITEVFNTTNGNPYFTNIVCARVYANAVKERDSDVTANEVTRATASAIGAFDANSFVHLWQDGIHKPIGSRDPDIIRRCRVLVAIARTLRRKQELTLANIIDNKHSVALSDGEVQPVLNDYMRREVLRETDGRRYQFVLPIFGMWLVEAGISRLSSDLSEELARSVQAAEDAAYVHSEEIVALTRTWPTYQGRQIGTDEVRAWCEQVEGHRQQRLLFKLLQNITFYSEVQIREKLKTAHASFVRPLLQEFVVRRRSDRRMDVLVTYIDGEGKSGQFYAARYAEVNGISTGSIVKWNELSQSLSERNKKGPRLSTIVVVDDIIATGESLATNLRMASADKIVSEGEVPVVVIVLAATVTGEQVVREEIAELDLFQVDLRVCDMLGADKFAFMTENIWKDRDEFAMAKSLCVDLGVRIYRDNPLGYGGQGLLVVFPETCPNNTLPILHSAARPDSDRKWIPLFPRIAN